MDPFTLTIELIKADDILNLGILEQYIEDKPYSIVPTVLYTERPDRAVSFLKEGHIILLMDSSPSCLVLPVTLWSFFHTSEDHYLRWMYGNFTRLIRLAALIVAVLTPALYIALTNYHIEMMPTDLVLNIASTRENVPFPAIFELLILLLAFELIREGGIRIPTPIGPTIGIVGALIIGQAAVEASIISPILVIVVAVTGLSSFAIPNLSLNFMIRIGAYLFIAAAYLWGFLGIAALTAVATGYLSSITSFGAPFLSPLSPPRRSSNDTLFRKQVWKDTFRPLMVSAKKSRLEKDTRR